MLADTIAIEEAEAILAERADEEAADGEFDFHLETAKKIWPRGVMIFCPQCGREETATVGQVARHLADGWPTCCGHTMWIGEGVEP